MVGLLLVSGILTVVAPAALTTVGARRRGSPWAPAVAAGMFFPITWAVWYVRDEHPYRRLAGSGA